jgi:hypothetical protein
MRIEKFVLSATHSAKDVFGQTTKTFHFLTPPVNPGYFVAHGTSISFFCWMCKIYPHGLHDPTTFTKIIDTIIIITLYIYIYIYRERERDSHSHFYIFTNTFQAINKLLIRVSVSSIVK